MDKLSYSDKVGVTCLPPEGAEISPNIDVKNRDNWNNCFIAGWGRLGTGAQVPPKQASKIQNIKTVHHFLFDSQDDAMK